MTIGEKERGPELLIIYQLRRKNMRDWTAMRECIVRQGILRAVGSVQSGTLISVRFWVWFLGHMTGYSKRITIVVSGHLHFQESYTHEAQNENEQRSENDIKIEIDRSIGNSCRFDKETKVPPRYAK